MCIHCSSFSIHTLTWKSLFTTATCVVLLLCGCIVGGIVTHKGSSLRFEMWHILLMLKYHHKKVDPLLTRSTWRHVKLREWPHSLQVSVTMSRLASHFLEGSCRYQLSTGTTAKLWGCGELISHELLSFDRYGVVYLKYGGVIHPQITWALILFTDLYCRNHTEHTVTLKLWTSVCFGWRG